MRKARSVRKPLRDVSNNNQGGVRRTAKKEAIGIDKQQDVRIPKEDKGAGEERNGSECLDRLLLVHSDLCSFTQQIDELIAQAFKVKATNKEGRKEIEVFTQVLSDMLFSLKPWVPRFRKVLSSPSTKTEDQLGLSLARKTASAVNGNENLEIGSPEQRKLECMVSPSPLVSWRADCNIERGRQLFLLTPLPISKTLSSRHQHLPTSVFERMTSNPAFELPSFLTISKDGHHDLLKGKALKPTPNKPCDSDATAAKSTLEFVSSPIASKRDHSLLVMTPCSKMSPPKSCVLLQPISESSIGDNDRVRKSTPFPNGIHSLSSESSDSEGSDGLALKYPELLGIQQAYLPRMGTKELESSPDWSFSPPKTCILLEPLDEKSKVIAVADQHAAVNAPVLGQQTLLTLSYHNGQETLASSLQLVESTPMCKEPDSTKRTGKRPGENTLKKELWTKFEAASSYGVRLNVSAIHRTVQKGFLDMLDEASYDGKSSVANGLR